MLNTQKILFILKINYLIKIGFSFPCYFLIRNAIYNNSKQIQDYVINDGNFEYNYNNSDQVVNNSVTNDDGSNNNITIMKEDDIDDHSTNLKFSDIFHITSLFAAGDIQHIF